VYLTYFDYTGGWFVIVRRAGGMDVLSLVSVVCCQVEVFAYCRSLIQSSSTRSMPLSAFRCTVTVYASSE
jgi:hypothetical protein